MLSEIFWIALNATASGMIIKLASFCFQSKCKECTVCGGRIKIIRYTESEEKLREFELTHPQQMNQPSSP